jgi:hypothetical protein
VGPRAVQVSGPLPTCPPAMARTVLVPVQSVTPNPAAVRTPLMEPLEAAIAGGAKPLRREEHFYGSPIA